MQPVGTHLKLLSIFNVLKFITLIKGANTLYIFYMENAELKHLHKLVKYVLHSPYKRHLESAKIQNLDQLGRF